MNARENAVHGVLDLIGNTPLVEITKLCACSGIGRARIFAKLEFCNPSGSIKDRAALYMIERAEKKGLIKNKKIVEATSGNMGISFAMIAAARNYEFTAVMPDFSTKERCALIEQYGAKVVLTSAGENYHGAIKKARQIAKELGAWFPDQYENEDNASAHEQTTGKEILSQAGAVDAFVAGIGTGGTLVGVARAVRKKFPNAQIIGVEPEESRAISGGNISRHGIAGIGVGFVPALYEKNKLLANEIISVSTKQAIACAKELACSEGLRAGISSGANVFAALQVASRLKKGAVVTVLPDASDRYYSTELFE